MTTTVRLPVQDGVELSVLYVKVPTDQITARRFPVLDRTVRLSDRDRHSAAYESCPPVFAPLATVTAWLDGMGWEHSDTAPEAKS